MFKVVDNIVPVRLQEDLNSYCFGDYFPWYYIQDITRNAFVQGEYAQPGFHHTPFNEYNPRGSSYDYFKWMSFFIEEQIGYHKPLHLFRIRCGLNISNVWNNREFEQEWNHPHIDHNPEIVTGQTFTCLYYVNDSDGDTFVFNETKESKEYSVMHRITPKQGRIAIFDGKQYHASSSPKQTNARVVLTFNFHEKLFG